MTSFGIYYSLARAVLKAPKSCHTTPIVCSLHWLKITERIEHEFLSLTCTYKVLTTSQPSYTHKLVSLQLPRSTCSSSLLILTRPPTSSSFRLTDRSFRRASPCLWNQLPTSLLQFHPSLSISDSPLPAFVISSFSVDSLFSSVVTPSLFHSQLKTYLFHKSFQP